MTHLFDLVLFAARVVLIMFCARHALLLLGNAVRTYAELLSGIGGLMYVIGVAIDYAGLAGLIPGHDLSRLVCAIGLALAVLPYVLQWAAPRLYVHISQE